MQTQIGLPHFDQILGSWLLLQNSVAQLMVDADRLAEDNGVGDALRVWKAAEIISKMATNGKGGYFRSRLSDLPSQLIVWRDTFMFAA